MRILATETFVTMDGIMQAPGGPGEDEAGGFQSGGWSVNYWDDMMGQVMGESYAKKPELLLGRKTYDIFASYWPFHPDEPGADNLNNAKKYVVSRTLDKADWANTTLIKGDAVQEIARLKAADGPEIQVPGSGNLIQTLLQHNLVDEMRLWIFPVAIGKGKRLFGEGAHPSGFKLIDCRTSTTGVIIVNYALSGELKTGSFA